MTRVRRTDEGRGGHSLFTVGPPRDLRSQGRVDRPTRARTWTAGPSRRCPWSSGSRSRRRARRRASTSHRRDEQPAGRVVALRGVLDHGSRIGQAGAQVVKVPTDPGPDHDRRTAVERDGAVEASGGEQPHILFASLDPGDRADCFAGGARISSDATVGQPVPSLPLLVQCARLRESRPGTRLLAAAAMRPPAGRARSGCRRGPRAGSAGRRVR